MADKKLGCAEKTVKIGASDLPLCCPMNDQELWNAHPKVYLPIEKHGSCLCPYCGTTYVLNK